MNIATAERRAKRFMKKHNLIQSGWTFQYITSNRCFGICKYGSKEICLSKPLTEINNWEKVKDTILHEIAHALTPRQNHNHVWVAKAIEIGCNGKRCYGEEVKTPESKVLLCCPKCDRQSNVWRMPKRVKSCGKCSPSFTPHLIMTLKKNPKYMGDLRASYLTKMDKYNNICENQKAGKKEKSVAKEIPGTRFVKKSQRTEWLRAKKMLDELSFIDASFNMSWLWREENLTCEKILDECLFQIDHCKSAGEECPEDKKSFDKDIKDLNNYIKKWEIV